MNAAELFSGTTPGATSRSQQSRPERVMLPPAGFSDPLHPLMGVAGREGWGGGLGASGAGRGGCLSTAEAYKSAGLFREHKPRRLAWAAGRAGQELGPGRVGSFMEQRGEVGGLWLLAHSGACSFF